jgi:hypothetical protein
MVVDIRPFDLLAAISVPDVILVISSVIALLLGFDGRCLSAMRNDSRTPWLQERCPVRAIVILTTLQEAPFRGVPQEFGRA